jgi:hypothetical protein
LISGLAGPLYLRRFAAKNDVPGKTPHRVGIGLRAIAVPAVAEMSVLTAAPAILSS